MNTWTQGIRANTKADMLAYIGRGLNVPNDIKVNQKDIYNQKRITQ